MENNEEIFDINKIDYSQYDTSYVPYQNPWIPIAGIHYGNITYNYSLIIDSMLKNINDCEELKAKFCEKVLKIKPSEFDGLIKTLRRQEKFKKLDL